MLMFTSPAALRRFEQDKTKHSKQGKHLMSAGSASSGQRGQLFRRRQEFDFKFCYISSE